MLERTLRHAEAFLASLEDRPVGPPVDPDALRAALGHELTDEGVPAEQVIDELVAGAEPGIVASAGPRYFGFVTGGALPAALAADWLTSTWDQNAHMWVGSPAASVVEEVVEDWVLSLLGLPASASVGLVTGAQMANVTCLAVARDHVLKQAGWDAASQGLIGAPPLTVIAGEEAHATVFSALRLLGLGRDAAQLVAVDDQGAMDPDALARDARGRRPGDRLRAGGQRQQRRLRPAGADRVPVRAVRRVAARRRRLRPVGGGEPVLPPPRPAGSSAPTAGPPTRTSGSTSPTTAGWRSSRTAPRTAAR